jgi:hypothetical protein
MRYQFELRDPGAAGTPAAPGELVGARESAAPVNPLSTPALPAPVPDVSRQAARRPAATSLAFRPRRVARIVAAMARLGMVVDTGPPPKFPLWAVYGVSDFDAVGRPVGGRAGEYETALRRILSSHGRSSEPGIPLHKLRTNLGWHVTADECRAAVRRYDRWRGLDQPSPAAFGEDLMPFLRAAAARDGFEVH